MNYKIALSAAFVAAIGLTGCDSRDNARDAGSTNVDQSAGSVQSGTTAPGTGNTGTIGDANAGQNSVGTSANAPGTEINNTRGTGTQEGDYANVNADREDEMVKRKVNPAHTDAAKAKTQPISSGSTSDSDDLDKTGDLGASDDLGSDDLGSDDSADNSDVYRSTDYDDDVLGDDEVVSGSTSEPMDSSKESYRQTDLPGGMRAQDRNLRFGLIGNGTGMGLEDTSSKFMTDNYTLSDPTIANPSLANSGALSAPTDDQDALKDIKSGSSFDPENYHIENED